MHKASWASWLSTYDIGGRRYAETTLADYPQAMRNMNVPVSRRPVEMREWRFTTLLFTAVSASKAGDVRYLICVERVA